MKRTIYNQEPITIEDFLGLYARGDDTNVPPNYLIECQNCKFEPGSIFSREGSTISYNHETTVNRFFFRHSEDLGNILLYLDNVGQLFGVRMGVKTLLHTNPAAVDFSITDTLNRVFITFHDGNQGIAGEFVYWWDGTNFAPIAGARPTAAGSMTAVNGAAGKVDAGTHLIAVAYETRWGFITGPGPLVAGVYTPTSYVAPGALKINLSGIPLGPAGTRYRHILMSKAGLPELFFVPNGRIPDNTTTTLIIDCYDTELIESADYLFNLLTSVPSGVKLFKYAGRLGILGFPAPDNSLVRLSRNDGDFESFDATTGFLLVNQDDRRKNKNAFEFRSNLYLGKSQGWFMTVDNGEEPVNWPNPVCIDAAVGCEVNSVVELPDVTSGATKEHVLVGDRSGLLVFNGIFQEISLAWSIRDIWRTINKENFYKIQVLNDPINKFIYVNIPYGATEPDRVLFGDYSSGLSPDKIRWSVWKFDNDVPKTISIMDLDGNGPIFRYGKVDNIYRMCSGLKNDFGVPIDAFFKTHLGTLDDGSGAVFQYNTVKAQVEGVGTMDVSIEGLNKQVIVIPTTQTLLPAPRASLTIKFNFKNEKVAAKFRVTELDEWFEFTVLRINGVYYGAEVPA